MIAVSDKWKELQQEQLLPESFVEVSCAITELGVQEEATAVGINEEIFSNVTAVLDTYSEPSSKRYATLETNLWLLDGSRTILPDSEPYHNRGYVGDQLYECGSDNRAGVTLRLPEVHENAIPGVTIVWSSEYDEYPHNITVTAKNGEEIVAQSNSNTVIETTGNKTLVYLDISNYDSVTITIHDWCLPNHRPRVDRVLLGLDVTFTKAELLSFTHEQRGSIITGELPKNSINFSIDNSDNRWNPNNPTGLEKYLSERQRLTVRYGLDLGDKTEWVKAGTFYLSEWKTPANGIEASFSARDVFEYMLNEPYIGRKSGTLFEIAKDAIDQAGLPQAPIVDSSLADYSATFERDYTIAEILQLCANAACCVMYQDRNGVLHIEPLSPTDNDYVVSRTFSYSWPEIDLSKILKNVLVSWGNNNSYVLPVSSTGETQTVSNPLIGSEEQAAIVAEWVKNDLVLRKMVTGEYRADPRIDLFDRAVVYGKFNAVMTAIITDIKYSYTGAFRGSYTGRVIGWTEDKTEDED